MKINEETINGKSITVVSDGEGLFFYNTAEFEAAELEWGSVEEMWWGQGQPAEAELTEEEEEQLREVF